MLQIPEVKLRDGRKIQQLGVGTYKLEPANTLEIVGAALELGYRHIDTAKIYRNEVEVGQALAASSVARDDVWVTTKLWHDEHDDAIGALQRSLERLQLESVDLFLIHWPVPKLGTAWRAWQDIIEAQQRGLVKSIGVSNFEIPHLERIMAETGVVPVVNQIEVHPHHQRRKLRDFCAAHEIAVESWSPLARGRAELMQERAVVKTAQAHNVTAAQVVLRWHLQHGLIVFPKTSRVARLTENAKALDFELTSEQMLELDALEIVAASGSNPYDFNG
ncbi:aldo/keto reductase [Canibacter sp. lx-72]|uniref:aldo/keto reductase n=1 Tax=Canibacter zhuwentaonis TaxID=2837491 RepID=UPI001BDD3B04|nr:aldo/keto reductase [Canibacter zhuwentaonis]MBT1017536.1 aldo/keto reductase [Canibacter zhuwentaonis]